MFRVDTFFFRPQRILHSVLTSRIILHLRIASSDPQEIEMRPPTSFHHSDPSCNIDMTSTFSGDTGGTVSTITDMENQGASVESNPL